MKKIKSKENYQRKNSKMKISLIAALDANMVIGNENSLIWKIPNDLKRFKQLTTGKTVVMGRKTFESIGGHLPNRTNIILTKDANYKAEGCIVVHSANEALKKSAGEEIMVMGGAQIYSEFLPKADKLYLTLIDAKFHGDAYFPDYKKFKWKEMFREEHNEEYNYIFVDLERIRN